MRRVLNHTLISGGALAVVVTVLVLIDERVQHAIASLWRDVPSEEVVQASSALTQIGSAVITAIQEQSIANAPLMIFVVVASVLMLFMVRT
jgi:hypothetical protein